MLLGPPLDADRRHDRQRERHPIVWLWLSALALGVAIVGCGFYALIWLLTHSD